MVLGDGPSSPRYSEGELAELVEYLDDLDDQGFSNQLAHCILDPYPIAVAAFRSEGLAARSLAAAQYLIAHANTTIDRREPMASMKSKQLATARFRDRVGMERRLLADIVAGDRARDGLVTNAPSPHARALKRL